MKDSALLLILPFSLLAGVALVAAPQAKADNWPNWRGPQGNSVAPPGDYPVQWNTEQNIKWKIELPGWGTSTPAIWQDHIFVTGTQEQGSENAEAKNVLLAFDRQGQMLWQRELGTAAEHRNRKASAANPSPVTDGEKVFAYFKSGDLACLDFDGEVIWKLNLQEKYGPDQLLWDLGTSPVLAGDLLIVAVMHQGPSYVVALDKHSGQVAWKKDRDLGAPGEARDSYTTPIVTGEGDEKRLLILGGDGITAHDAATGDELWRVDTLNPQQRGNFRSIASPALGEQLVIAPYARGETLTAVRTGGRGNVSDSHIAWQTFEFGADVPTPVVHDGRIYLCGDRGEIHCLELETGKHLWSERLPGSRYPYSASPVLAGDKLYVTREDGTTFVLQIGDQPKVVAENALQENTYATPVFVDGDIYQRTSNFLFCISKD